MTTNSKPILFTGPMVCAIFEGRKTETRRVVTVHWHKGKRTVPYEPYYTDEDGKLLAMDEGGEYFPMEKLSPYGAPGDRLWVKEHWRTTAGWDHEPPRNIPPDFEDGSPMIWYEADGPIDPLNDCHWEIGRFRPGMFMPRWASRLTLSVTGIRVERLLDITEEGARAEGFENRAAFLAYFDGLNAKRGHEVESNPWVWVVQFTKETKA